MFRARDVFVNLLEAELRGTTLKQVAEQVLVFQVLHSSFLFDDSEEKLF